MQRFSPKVKLFVLDERRAGKAWKQIQQGIKDRFNISPPSIRAMEKWDKEIDRDRISELLIEEGRRSLPGAEAMTLQQMAEGLIPVLWHARDTAGDMELDGWLWFFSLIERQLGREKFERFLSEYRKRRSMVGGEHINTP